MVPFSGLVSHPRRIPTSPPCLTDSGSTLVSHSQIFRLTAECLNNIAAFVREHLSGKQPFTVWFVPHHGWGVLQNKVDVPEKQTGVQPV